MPQTCTTMFVRQTNLRSWLRFINSPPVKRNKNTFHLSFKRSTNSHSFFQSSSQTHWSLVYGHTLSTHKLRRMRPNVWPKFITHLWASLPFLELREKFEEIMLSKLTYTCCGGDAGGKCCQTMIRRGRSCN